LGNWGPAKQIKALLRCRSDRQLSYWHSTGAFWPVSYPAPAWFRRKPVTEGTTDRLECGNLRDAIVPRANGSLGPDAHMSIAGICASAPRRPRGIVAGAASRVGNFYSPRPRGQDENMTTASGWIRVQCVSRAGPGGNAGRLQDKCHTWPLRM